MHLRPSSRSHDATGTLYVTLTLPATCCVCESSRTRALAMRRLPFCTSIKRIHAHVAAGNCTVYKSVNITLAALVAQTYSLHIRYQCSKRSKRQRAADARWNLHLTCVRSADTALDTFASSADRFVHTYHATRGSVTCRHAHGHLRPARPPRFLPFPPPLPPLPPAPALPPAWPFADAPCAPRRSRCAAAASAAVDP